MAISLGRHQTIGIGRQGTRGTGDTANYWLRKTAWSENPVEQQIFDESAAGTNSATRGVGVDRLHAEPSVSGYIDINSFGLIEYANGDTYGSPSEVESGVYDHEIKVGTTTYADKFLTLNIDDAKTDGDLDFIDAIINTLNMPLNIGQRAMFDASFVSRYRASGTNTAAFVTPQYFYSKNITVKFASSVANFDTAASVYSASLNRSNNVNSDETAFVYDGTQNISNHHMTERSAELTFSQLATGLTYKDYAKDGDVIACQIVISDPSTTIGAASNPTLTYTFPTCSVKVARNEENGQLRKEDLTLTAHEGLDDDESATYLYKVEIRNTVADYSSI